MNITPDTNFLISATQWETSVANKLLTFFIEKDIQIYTSEGILKEFKDVLQRDFKYSGDGADKIINYIKTFANIIEPPESIDIVEDDPDDNKIIECAIASNSEYIISYDKHLLSLESFRGIKIIKPEDFPKTL